ncbi:hypothetical protein EJ110_NYTH33929 [Nymphaea thermarum]|nr:hypothetical protein EJ110_NYTH33929 [Nymphaea thermarum]
MAVLSTSVLLVRAPSRPLGLGSLLRSNLTPSLSKRGRVFCSQRDEDSSSIPTRVTADETPRPHPPATHHHQQPDLAFSYSSASGIGIRDPKVVVRPQRSAESTVERVSSLADLVLLSLFSELWAYSSILFGYSQGLDFLFLQVIFDFRFLALLAIGGSLAGSVLCFLNIYSSVNQGCVYIVDAYKVYLSSCVKGIHTGQMVLRLVEAIDVYLAGTVMLIFGMGLYGLFISNDSADVPTTHDRALKGSSLFGMFALKVQIFVMKSHT